MQDIYKSKHYDTYHRSLERTIAVVIHLCMDPPRDLGYEDLLRDEPQCGDAWWYLGDGLGTNIDVRKVKLCETLEVAKELDECKPLRVFHFHVTLSLLSLVGEKGVAVIEKLCKCHGSSTDFWKELLMI